VQPNPSQVNRQVAQPVGIQGQTIERIIRNNVRSVIARTAFFMTLEIEKVDLPSDVGVPTPGWTPSDEIGEAAILASNPERANLPTK
jgi:hypothetical protein